MADRLGIESIDREGRAVVLRFRAQAKVDPTRLVGMVRARPELSLVPPSALRLSLDSPPPAGGRTQPGGRPSPGPSAASPSRKGGRQSPPPSWWTARARTGEVSPGFTKQEILKPAKADPRSPGGVFERVGGLLAELIGQ